MNDIDLKLYESYKRTDVWNCVFNNENGWTKNGVKIQTDKLCGHFEIVKHSYINYITSIKVINNKENSPLPIIKFFEGGINCGDSWKFPTIDEPFYMLPYRFYKLVIEAPNECNDNDINVVIEYISLPENVIDNH